jgi:hypothetical protein
LHELREAGAAATNGSLPLLPVVAVSENKVVAKTAQGQGVENENQQQPLGKGKEDAAAVVASVETPLQQQQQQRRTFIVDCTGFTFVRSFAILICLVICL